jgi:hypothetical protein
VHGHEAAPFPETGRITRICAGRRTSVHRLRLSHLQPPFSCYILTFVDHGPIRHSQSHLQGMPGAISMECVRDNDQTDGISTSKGRKDWRITSEVSTSGYKAQDYVS